MPGVSEVFIVPPQPYEKTILQELHELIADGVSRSEELQRITGGGSLILSRKALYLINTLVRLENDR